VRQYLILTATLALPASVFAAQPQIAAGADQAQSMSSERRLTPQEIERILDEASARREAAEAAALDTGPKISGEMGISIGTGGYRSVFGSAYMPLDDGFASFSFSTERSRDSYGIYDRYDGYGVR
jgi:hypothetical protein